MPRDPSDLVNHNCLRYPFSDWGSEWHFGSTGNAQTVHVTGNLEANSTAALKLAAVLGQGLILTPHFLVKEEIKSGSLMPVLTDFRTPARSINGVYPDRHLSTGVRSFLDLVMKRLSTDDD